MERRSEKISAGSAADSHGNKIPAWTEEPAMSMSFCYTLGGNARALAKFGAMTEEEKRQVLEAARSARSKEEIRSLVRDVAEL